MTLLKSSAFKVVSRSLVAAVVTAGMLAGFMSPARGDGAATYSSIAGSNVNLQITTGPELNRRTNPVDVAIAADIVTITTGASGAVETFLAAPSELLIGPENEEILEGYAGLETSGVSGQITSVAQVVTLANVRFTVAGTIFCGGANGIPPGTHFPVAGGNIVFQGGGISANGDVTLVARGNLGMVVCSDRALVGTLGMLNNVPFTMTFVMHKTVTAAADGGIPAVVVDA